MALDVAEQVWVPAAEDGAAFVRGTVRDISGTAVKVDVGSQARTFQPGDVRRRFVRDDGCTCPDNTSLVYMNDAEILDNLRRRYASDDIYTYTASVLLAVNPYKVIDDLYSDARCAQYRGKHIGSLPPHPYALADTAYRGLMREKRSQALLISGESGAGKTETAKIVMQYLAYASGTSNFAGRIQCRVLQAQPILESFGNAVTLRNSNSSRFGKYNRVYFDDSGALVDAGITTYLLESSRVVSHGERERTYHVFYEMLEGLDDSELAKLKLERGQLYRLLNVGGSQSKPAAGSRDRDRRNFVRLREALAAVGFNDDATASILRVLAGLVHLGDVVLDLDESVLAIQEDDENATIPINEESLETAAELLGMDAAVLGETIKRKTIKVKGKDPILVPRNEIQVRQAVHGLIKALYKRLFARTVQRINDSFAELRPPVAASEGYADEGVGDQPWQHMGILDIYGFERLERNSFEQMCINLANERLQNYFVENVLGAEQILYHREGLPWTNLELPDSTPVVRCIAQVFHCLDERAKLQNATDEQFCESVFVEVNKDAQMRDILTKVKVSNKRGARNSVAPANNEAFVVKHYAGIVEYTTKGWLDKNNDRLLFECEDLIGSSVNGLVNSLHEDDDLARTFRSISKKYTADLEALLQTLNTCTAHYIRCFKPNEEQKPGLFRNQLVLDQIIQCGTVELVKIMHDGYPNRCPFDEIASRFRALLPESFQRYGVRTFIEALMMAYDVKQSEWVLGMSRLFLKAGQLKNLEDMRCEGATPDKANLARIVRGIIKKRWCRVGHVVRLSLWIPKFIRQLQAERAAKTLSRNAVTVGRLALCLQKAQKQAQQRKLVARRRLRNSGSVALVLLPWLREVRRRRREANWRAFHVIVFIRVRAKRWMKVAQETLKVAERRREAERRQMEEQRKHLEEERRRLEEERQREEERRIAERRSEEDRRREEMRARLEELRIEEERRAAQRAKEREEEVRRQEESARQMAELTRVQHEQQRLQLEKERLALEQERFAFEERRKALIMQQATPQKMLSGSGAIACHARGGSAAEAERAGGKASAPSRGEAPPDEGDSGSPALQRQDVTEVVQRHVQELEETYTKKQKECFEQIRLLIERNNQLESTLHAERAANSQDSSRLESRQSRTPQKEPALVASRSPRCTPESLLGEKTSKRLSMSGNGNRLSLLSLSAEGTMPGDIAQARKWWHQQRGFLIEDLYPDELFPNKSSDLESSFTHRSSIARQSLVGPEDGVGGSTPTRLEPAVDSKLKQPKKYGWRRSMTAAERLAGE